MNKKPSQKLKKIAQTNMRADNSLMEFQEDLHHQLLNLVNDKVRRNKKSGQNRKKFQLPEIRSKTIHNQIKSMQNSLAFNEIVEQQYKKRMKDIRLVNKSLKKMEGQYDSDELNQTLYQRKKRKKQISHLHSLSSSHLLNFPHSHSHYQPHSHMNPPVPYYNPLYPPMYGHPLLHPQYPMYSNQHLSPLPHNSGSFNEKKALSQEIIEDSDDDETAGKKPLISTCKKVQNKVFSKLEKSKLRRKLRIACYVVYFTVIFPKFSRAMKNLKYERFLEYDNPTELKLTQKKVFNPLLNIKFFKHFEDSEEEAKENSDEKEETMVFVQDGHQINLETPVIMLFFTKIVHEICSFYRQGSIEQIYPYFIGLLNNNFPHNAFLLRQEASLISFTQDGKVLCSDSESKLLFISNMVIKNFIFPLLGKNKLAEAFKKQIPGNNFKRNKKQYLAKKIKIALLIFYQIIDEIIGINRGKIKKLKKEKNKIKVRLQNPLIYNFKIQSSLKKIEEKNQLIQGVKKNQFFIEFYSKKFIHLWNKILKTSDFIFKKVMEKYKVELSQMKEMAYTEFNHNKIEFDLYKDEEEDEEIVSQSQISQLDNDLTFFDKVDKIYILEEDERKRKKKKTIMKRNK